MQNSFELDHQGMMIRGSVYRPGAEGRWPTVLLLHGFTGHRIEGNFFFVHLARELVRRGMAAVTFDFRHSGESDGSFDQMRVTGEVADAVHVTQWLKNQPFVDVQGMGLLGFSLGGLVAACTAGRTGAYRALVLGAPTTVANICRLAGDGTPADRVQIGPHWLSSDFFPDVRTLDPLGDVVRHPRPTLVVQGLGDQAVKPAVSREYVESLRKAGVAVDTHDTPGADHVFSSPQWRAEFLQVVGEWLGRKLVG